MNTNSTSSHAEREVDFQELKKLERLVNIKTRLSKFPEFSFSLDRNTPQLARTLNAFGKMFSLKYISPRDEYSIISVLKALVDVKIVKNFNTQRFDHNCYNKVRSYRISIL